MIKFRRVKLIKARNCNLKKSFSVTTFLLVQHILAEASLGIRQSPRGERFMEPTLGPSGMQDGGLNC